jgi:elongation factor 1-gamma
MQFIFNTETQVDKHSSTILYQNLGYLKKDEDLTKMSYTYLDRNLEYYNTLLSNSDYLVANQLTLADISFFFGFFYPYIKYIDEERKSKFANVTKFMDRMSKDEKFAKVLVNAS